jgi:hypothetical protein
MKIARDEMEAEQSLERKAVAAQVLDDTFKKHKCHPFVNMLFFPFVLPPTVLTLFLGVHNLCLSEVAMGEEGCLWFPDLLSCDTTYLLPILASLSWLWLVEISAGVYYHAWRDVKTIGQTVALATIPLAALEPAGVLLFWVSGVDIVMLATTRGLVGDQAAGVDVLCCCEL